MATITFRLRKSTTGKGASIQLTFHYGKAKRFRYSTGLKIINFKNWDLNKMRVKNVVEEKFKTEINNQLNELTTQLEAHFVELSLNQKLNVTNDILKNFCNHFFNKSDTKLEETNTKEFIEYYDWFITNYSTKPVPTTGRPLGKGTVRTYRNSFNIIKRFNDELYKLTYDKITLQFYDDFLEWLYAQDYSANYSGTQIKVLKTIMQSATDKDFNHNLDFRKRYFRKPVENIDNVYLTNDEITRISDLDFSSFQPIKKNKTLTIKAKMLEVARDLFLIGCSTGLRVSDYNNLQEENIFTDDDNMSFFRIIMQKGHKPITIPINTTVRKILKKNQNRPPKRMPEQHINYCIKIIGELASIDELTVKTVTKGGTPTKITTPKYNLISNHTSRRSFCTNAYLSGMNTSDIMAISGHATEKVFYNYIKVNDLQKAQKIAKHDFFS
ncbi:site-specific recombinase XerD [Gillisia mitskevichiae]|uniref:Site-specific recombinase XerD n=1 Tax=Gillisia mitskevichiae TaxID=270921 RepID=A0A495Q0F7_9FLAO|nr:tyrosine-type recombinase/integrase [Gillisia mitskevichiae]RKS56179.1 site-specific recombinase XerD [Gillisia mitskevichiae]